MDDLIWEINKLYKHAFPNKVMIDPIEALKEMRENLTFNDELVKTVYKLEDKISQIDNIIN